MEETLETLDLGPEELLERHDQICRTIVEPLIASSIVEVRNFANEIIAQYGGKLARVNARTSGPKDWAFTSLELLIDARDNLDRMIKTSSNITKKDVERICDIISDAIAHILDTKDLSIFSFMSDPVFHLIVKNLIFSETDFPRFIVLDKRFNAFYDDIKSSDRFWEACRMMRNYIISLVVYQMMSYEYKIEIGGHGWMYSNGNYTGYDTLSKTNRRVIAYNHESGEWLFDEKSVSDRRYAGKFHWDLASELYSTIIRNPAEPVILSGQYRGRSDRFHICGTHHRAWDIEKMEDGTYRVIENESILPNKLLLRAFYSPFRSEVLQIKFMAEWFYDNYHELRKLNHTFLYPPLERFFGSHYNSQQRFALITALQRNAYAGNRDIFLERYSWNPWKLPVETRDDIAAMSGMMRLIREREQLLKHDENRPVALVGIIMYIEIYKKVTKSVEYPYTTYEDRGRHDDISLLLNEYWIKYLKKLDEKTPWIIGTFDDTWWDVNPLPSYSYFMSRKNRI